MKRSFILRIAIFSFFLAGLTLINADQQLLAQSAKTDDNIFALPQDIFVLPAEATLRLDAAVAPLKNLLLTYTEGTPEYKQVFAKYSCFIATQNFIVDGKTVAEAIVEGLRSMPEDQYELTKYNLRSFRQELINLLKV